jgi:glyoxylase-like metal-dependent hydrolase (beta-lactamase superfamily II)
MKTFATLALSACLAAAAHAQQDLSQVEIRSEALADGVHMLTGAGGNLALSIGEDAAFLVDDQFAPLAPRIKAAIARIAARPVRFVLNTHWHGDHTGGNENFGRAGAVLVAHENVRRRMSVEQFNESMNTRTAPSPKAALPVVTFASDVVFHLNGDEIRAFHVPHAHTDGDTIVHFRRANVVHLGDVFFNRLYPFIDTGAGGSLAGTIAAADKVLALAREDTKLIPGHGPLGSRADLLAYRQMLVTVGERLQALARDGKTLGDAIAARPTQEFDEVWGKGFMPPDKFVEMLWRDLNRQPPAK